jgi:hypothetical protein
VSGHLQENNKLKCKFSGLTPATTTALTILIEYKKRFIFYAASLGNLPVVVEAPHSVRFAVGE